MFCTICAERTETMKKISIQMLGRVEGRGEKKSQGRKGSWGSKCVQCARICVLVSQPPAGAQCGSEQPHSSQGCPP